MEEKKSLQITLAHEFRRCSYSFNEFAKVIAYLPYQNNQEKRIECYNFYADFIKYLYEFYAGIINHHYPNLKDSLLKTMFPDCVGKDKHEKLDIIITNEVRKLFRNRKERILRSEDDCLGHKINFYECLIPEYFGQHFRYIRNKNSHTAFERASSSATITLSEFYKKYHKFVIILYYELREYWYTKPNEFHFNEIEDFANVVLEDIENSIR